MNEKKLFLFLIFLFLSCGSKVYKKDFFSIDYEDVEIKEEILKESEIKDFEGINDDSFQDSEEKKDGEFEEEEIKKNCSNKELWGVVKKPEKSVPCEKYPRRCWRVGPVVKYPDKQKCPGIKSIVEHFFYPTFYEYTKDEKIIKIKGWWNNGDYSCFGVYYFLLPTGWITIDIDIEKEEIILFDFVPIKRYMGEDGYGVKGFDCEEWLKLPSTEYYSKKESVVFEINTENKKVFSIYARGFKHEYLQINSDALITNASIRDLIHIKREDGSEKLIGLDLRVCKAMIDELFDAGCVCPPSPITCIDEISENESFFSFYIEDKYIIFWESAPIETLFRLNFEKYGNTSEITATYIEIKNMYRTLSFSINGGETGKYPKPYTKGKYGPEMGMIFMDGFNNDKPNPTIFDGYHGWYSILLYNPFINEKLPEALVGDSMEVYIDKIVIGKCKWFDGCEGYIEGTFEGIAENRWTKKNVQIKNGKFRIYGK